MTYPKRGEVYWVNLDPTIGSEINKTRPAVIISNDIGNENSSRVIIAPITSSIARVYGFEVLAAINDKDSKIMLDQIRSISKMRMQQKITTLNKDIMIDVDKRLKLVLSLL